MSVALENVCGALRLKAIDDAATRVIAEEIIEFAQRGITDPAKLAALTLQEFKPDGSPPSDAC